MEINHSCYCCSNSMAGCMDIDAALSELGMLSSVTNSRKQYLRERIQRSRNVSESGVTVTPCTSPTKPGYKVLQINPRFVTSLSTANTASPSTLQAALSSSSHDTKRDSSFKENQISQTFSLLNLGQKYSTEVLESESKSARLSRTKVSRIRHFKKPYEVPWRMSMETQYTNVEHHEANSLKTLYTPNALCSEDTESTGNSNVSTPEKLSSLSQKRAVTVQRSRSLDDLEFAKLRLAEDGDAHEQNFVRDRQDIDNVSQHLKDLHMFE